MIEIMVRFLGKLFKRHNHLGNIRTKSESFAPRVEREYGGTNSKKINCLVPLMYILRKISKRLNLSGQEGIFW